jgi:hypothetical protein
MAFKKGDKLICIEGHREVLLTGKVYTFDRYSPLPLTPRLYIIGDTQDWYCSRFILATPLLEALS